ncbi:conserved hypothetical protein [Candida dubliniensis CD36]|uniref:Uncharacterized protein n=1 Tax=Candida dubliniensis (strain CD36 / ATCC MYA-646 / CBS 7987 / NCPF 3949 / NRRL Y-17841) TaxID=573826 RepID=B9W9W1_CANDC|nr:conserved hypothetical protein [Candida dubliniensis CD36]CAX45599.1 conserved hypothetical protein [Candida dubliniensis CD36]
MSSVREIPGYYYDEERRRYFKIVNGAIPSNSSSSSSSSSSQSVSKYHNNSIQAKQRYTNHLAKTTASTNKQTKPNKILKIPKIIIKNPNLSSQQLQYLQNLKIKFANINNEFSYTPIGLINFKTGTTTIKSRNNLINRISSIPPKYIPTLVPRGYVIDKFKQYLIISRLGLRQTIHCNNGNIYDYYPRSIVIQSPLIGKIIEIPMNWQFYHQSNGQIDKYDSIDKFYHDCGIDGFDNTIISGGDINNNNNNNNTSSSNSNSIFLLSIMKHSIQGNINFILRFNVIKSLNNNSTTTTTTTIKEEELSFHDYTCQLMEFLYDNILKQNLNKSLKKQLFNALGIPLCYFTKDMPNYTIQQINQILNTNSSLNRNKNLSKKINEFIYQQENNPPTILYRFKQYSNTKGYRIVNYQTFQNFIYLTISNGIIIKFKWSNYQFSNFQLVDIKIDNSLQEGQLLIVHEEREQQQQQQQEEEEEDVNPFYILRTGCKLITIKKKKKNTTTPMIPSSSINGNKGNNDWECKRILKNYKIIKKILMTQTNQLIIILFDSIISINFQNINSLSSLSPILVCDYFNDNDIYQQFELIDNLNNNDDKIDYLIFNIDKNYNQFKLIELNNSIDNDKFNHIIISIPFQFQKCGYLKNFKLMKIIPLKEESNDKLGDNQLMMIGFNFLNHFEMTTIFETFQL